MRFGTPSAGTLERFRERTATAIPISLRRKQCACGKIVTAKQLVQHGACNTCAQVKDTAKEAA